MIFITIVSTKLCMHGLPCMHIILIFNFSQQFPTTVSFSTTIIDKGLFHLLFCLKIIGLKVFLAQDVYQHKCFPQWFSWVPTLETSGSCQTVTVLGSSSAYYTFLQHLSLCCPGEEHHEAQAPACSVWLFVAGTVCGQVAVKCGRKCQLFQFYWLLCVHWPNTYLAFTAKSLLCLLLNCRGDMSKCVAVAYHEKSSQVARQHQKKHWLFDCINCCGYLLDCDFLHW